MPRRGPPADPTSLHFLLLSFPLSAGPAVPGQGILIKIQCTVTNRSEQSLISTRVRRGLALITAHLEDTIKWIDKPFKREVNFFFLHLAKSGFLLYKPLKEIEFIYWQFFLREILSSYSFHQGTFKLAGWVAKGLAACVILACVGQQRHTLQHLLPPIKDTAGEG